MDILRIVAMYRKDNTWSIAMVPGDSNAWTAFIVFVRKRDFFNIFVTPAENNRDSLVRIAIIAVTCRLLYTLTVEKDIRVTRCELCSSSPSDWYKKKKFYSTIVARLRIQSTFFSNLKSSNNVCILTRFKNSMKIHSEFYFHWMIVLAYSLFQIHVIHTLFFYRSDNRKSRRCQFSNVTLTSIRY